MTLPTPPKAISPIALRLLRASGLVAFGNIFSRVVALLVAVVTARMLTEIQYGAFGVVQNSLSMFGITATLGLGISATRFIALHRHNDSKRIGNIVTVVFIGGFLSSLATAAFMVAIAPWLARGWLADPSLIGPLRWAAGQLVVVAGFGLALGVLNGAERFKMSAAISVVQNVVILATSFLLVPRFKTIGAIGAQFLGFATALACGAWFARDLIGRFSSTSIRQAIASEARPVLEFCLPVVLGGLCIYPASWYSLSIISRVRDGLVEVAFFAAADRYRLIILFIATFVGTALLPILSGTQAKGSADEGTGPRGLEIALIGSSILIVPLTTFIAFGGPEIMALFGRTYRVNWAVLLPVIAWGAAGAHFSTIGTALMAHGRQWFLFLQQLIYGGLVVILAYLLRSYGGAGLGLAHLTTSFLVILLSIPVLRHIDALTNRAMLVIVGSIATICVTCALAALCPQEWRTVLVIPGSILMFLFSWVTFTTSEERKQIRGLLGRSEWSSWRSEKREC